MKIDEALRLLRSDLSLDSLREDIAEALEQHHKDLMGLVVEWRKDWVSYGTPNYKDGYDAAMDYCADQLESLINPKD